MAPKKPTCAQHSSKLSYQQHIPSFLLKLQNRVAGIPDEDEEEERDPGFKCVRSGQPIPNVLLFPNDLQKIQEVLMKTMRVRNRKLQ